MDIAVTAVCCGWCNTDSPLRTDAPFLNNRSQTVFTLFDLDMLYVTVPRQNCTNQRIGLITANTFLESNLCNNYFFLRAHSHLLQALLTKWSNNSILCTHYVSIIKWLLISVFMFVEVLLTKWFNNSRLCILFFCYLSNYYHFLFY